ncbi:MAG: hypothetical protein WC797_03830 [Candidatus Paceibacterota bacterium]
MLKKLTPALIGTVAAMAIAWIPCGWCIAQFLANKCCAGADVCLHIPSHELSTTWTPCYHTPQHDVFAAFVYVLLWLLSVLLSIGLGVMVADYASKRLIVHIPAYSVFVTNDEGKRAGETIADIFLYGATFWRYGKDWKKLRHFVLLSYDSDSIPVCRLSYDNGPIRFSVAVLFPREPWFVLEVYKNRGGPKHNLEALVQKIFFDFLRGLKIKGLLDRWYNPLDLAQTAEFRKLAEDYFLKKLPVEYQSPSLEHGKIMVICDIGVNDNVVSFEDRRSAGMSLLAKF